MEFLKCKICMGQIETIWGGVIKKVRCSECEPFEKQTEPEITIIRKRRA
jgi:hypothetical protein